MIMHNIYPLKINCSFTLVCGYEWSKLVVYDKYVHAAQMIMSLIYEVLGCVQHVYHACIKLVFNNVLEISPHIDHHGSCKSVE